MPKVGQKQHCKTPLLPELGENTRSPVNLSHVHQIHRDRIIVLHLRHAVLNAKV